MSTTRQPLRRALTAVLGGLAVVGVAQVVAPPPSSAGQLGLTTQIQGAGRVTVIEGSLEDGGATVCQFPQVLDEREVNSCARVRNWEPFAASVWLRPEAVPGWRFDHWNGCDETRTQYGIQECKVSSDNFNSTERSPRAVFVDVVLPEVVSAEQRYSTSRNRAVTYDFAVNKGRTECSFEGGGWQSCESGLERVFPTSGNYTTGVRAVDASGRTSPTHVFETHVIDTELVSVPPRVTHQTASDFVVRAPLASSLQCSLDGGAVHTCGSPDVPFRITTGDGDHELVVYGQSPLGRDHTPVRYQWSVDSTAPDTRTDGAVVTGRSVEISFGGDADAVRFECRLNGGAWQGCTSPVRYQDLAPGDFLFEARGADALGNLDPTAASASFTITPATGPIDPARPQPTTASVVRVVDADTLVVRAGRRTLTVDVAGLAAPAAPRCHAQRGLASLRALARVGRTVRIAPTPASSLTRRSPWTVTSAGRDVAQLQLRAGHARFDRAEAPAARRVGYAAAQSSARSAHRGLWGRC